MIDRAATILVVDDTPSKRYVICNWLRRAGYDLIEAETGTAALQRIADNPIDLVVLDVRLPDMSGFEVCERIKGSPAHASIPVIHVSAAAVEMGDRTQGLDRGADAYLVEPIEPDELLATVHAILRYYRGRQVAERLAARLSTLARLGVTLSHAKSAGPLLEAAAAGAATIYQAPTLVCAETSDGVWLAATVDGPDRPAVVRRWTPPATFPSSGGIADLPAEHLGLPHHGGPDLIRISAAAARPGRRPVYVGVPAAATDPGAPVLRLLTQAIAASVETLRVFVDEHQLALTLQESLLPQRLPAVPQVDMAKRYVPASETAEIGGDFYELSMMDDLLVVAVGDVGGHSLHAATVMGELRHAMRAYLADGHRPAAVVDRLNVLMRRFLPDEIATLCLLTLDPATGRMTVANAGHPGPLLIDGDSITQLTEHNALLGLSTMTASEWVVELPAGATIVLYTDGLVERRGEPINDGIARLVAAAGDPDPDLDAYCERLVRQVGPAEPLDDIAVVAVRRHPAPSA